MAGQIPQPQYAPQQLPAKPGGGNSVLMIILVIVGIVLLLTVLACVAMGLLLFPAFSAAKEAALNAQSQNNLKQIGLGIHNYHDTYKKMPRASMPDEKGAPRQSWRAAILPFIEQLQVYDRIDQSKAWNEPPNAQLNSQLIPPYHSPLDGDSSISDTSYVAIVGPNAAFDPGRQLAIKDMLNGTSNIVAVIEVENSGINWMEPRDFSAEEAFQYISTSEKPVNALMVDGSVRQLDSNIAPDVLRKLFARDSRPGAF